MLVETGKAFVDPPAMMTQMRENSRLLEFATFNVGRTILVITKHPKDGPGIAQMDNTTARIAYILVRKSFRSRVKLPEHEDF